MDAQTYAKQIAKLAVDVGANVHPGQIVAVAFPPGMEPIMHEIAKRAYERGAKFVDAQPFDGALKRIRLEHAAEDTLEFVPSWYGERLLAMSDEHAARIVLTPVVDPGQLGQVDPDRAGKDMLPALKEVGEVVGRRTTNWTIVPVPTPGWAQAVHPGLPADEAVDRLRGQLAHVCRLDEPDPAAAWRVRMDELEAVAARLTERRFDALHFTGPGTDLIVGLLQPGSHFASARMDTVDGIEHVANLPSEEIFTTPDPERTEGHVTSTKPLDVSGSFVDGLRVRFEGGRVVELDADTGAEALRGRVAKDDGAARLGEVALVDGDGRIANTGTVFFTTLLDENQASHIALGNGYADVLDDDDALSRMNRSAIHIDFMIGSNEVSVAGVTESGEEVPVLSGGRWLI
jgi:aminopeptidase